MQISINVFRWILGFIGSGFLIFVVTHFLQSKRMKTILIKIGKDSLQMYVMNRVVVSLILANLVGWLKKSYYVELLFQNQILFTFIIAVILSVFAVLAMQFLIRLISKNKYLSLIMFGRL